MSNRDPPTYGLVISFRLPFPISRPKNAWSLIKAFIISKRKSVGGSRKAVIWNSWRWPGSPHVSLAKKCQNIYLFLANSRFLLTTREQRDAEGGRTGGEGRKTKGRKGSRGKGRRMGGERSMVGKRDEVKGLTDLNGGKNKQKPQPNTHHTHTHIKKINVKRVCRDFLISS